MSQDQTQRSMNISVPSEVEVGTPADFVSVWHTPNAFLMDFIVLKKPPQTEVNEETGQRTARVDAVVSSRVRIPPEQVFPLIQALQAQGNMWLQETGRSTEPTNWLDAHHNANKDMNDPTDPTES
ncbi:DUF3467 domain-containing protein [Homoserinimonas sp. OAct 916]|uniref:DUF3467 domain-containing protein n=1 Tax=Homoserinimonas sp. OAct 916 TaxID=2211450 RepID=UPI0018E58899|nr:DUF3467 domain-containing protein [Homoserinimonas sp. OAct 916]